MENKAAPHMSAARGLRVVTIAALAGVLTMLVCFAGTAPAAKGQSFVAGDGKIHACYRVKGKPKGMMRIVRGKSHRCRRGERRMAWYAAAGPGGVGAQGQSGPSGSSAASVADENAELKAQIGNMTLRIAALEGLLDGVADGDLSGTLSRVNTLEGVLDNVDNEGLLNAVQAAPVVEDVCTQTEELTGRSNALLGFLDTLDALNVLSLPTALPAFNACPTP